MVKTEAKPTKKTQPDSVAEDLGIDTEESSSQSTQPVTRSESSGGAVARVQYDPASGIEGEADEDDLQLRSLAIVNGNGLLSQEYSQGAVILGDEQLFDAGKKGEEPVMRFVPIKLIKQYRQNLSQEERDSEVISQVVNTRAEAIEIDGPDAFTKNPLYNNKPRWSPSSKCFLLVERPEGSDHSAFTEVIDGKEYCPVVYYAGGVAYKNFFSPIYEKVRSQPDQRIFDHFWEFQAVRKAFGKFTVVVPRIRKLRSDETPDGLREMAENLTATAEVPDVDDTE